MRRTTILRAAVLAVGAAAVVAGAAALSALAGCGGTAAATGTPHSTVPKPSLSPISIGVIYSLTGPQAAFDSAALDGARLAIDGINAGGGLLGRRVELQEWDAQSDPAMARRAALSLVHTQVAAMIGLSDTAQVVAAAQVAALGGIPFVTSGATSTQLPARVPKWLFLACYGNNVQAAAGAQFSVQHLHAHNVAVLYDKDSEYTRQLQRYFDASLRTLGGSVVLQSGFHSGARDVHAMLDEENRVGDKSADKKGDHVPAARIDLIYLAANPADAAPLVRKLRAAGYRQPIMGPDSFAVDGLAAAAEATGGHV